MHWRPLNRKEGCTCNSRSEVGMARLVGGTGPVQDATAEVQSLADQVKCGHSSESNKQQRKIRRLSVCPLVLVSPARPLRQKGSSYKG